MMRLAPATLVALLLATPAHADCLALDDVLAEALEAKAKIEWWWAKHPPRFVVIIGADDETITVYEVHGDRPAFRRACQVDRYVMGDDA